MTENIVIEKGIPLTAIRRKEKQAPKYPFGLMEIGDSFLAKGKNIKSFSPYISVWVRRNSSDRKFSCRSVDGGVRVWRVQ